jgi:anti-sigma regulatory factor (Ser/Thr protein kinase)
MQSERLDVLAADWFPGEAASVRYARDFVRGVLGEGWPRLDDVLVMVSEIATNAVRHTASGGEDGWFDITVCAIGDGVRVSVGDSGGSSVPRIPRDGGEPDVMTGGRGLRIVDELADRWGHSGEELGRVVWFEVIYDK